MDNSNSLAPIALFVFNRLSHTKETVEALQKNTLAHDSELFIFADGPKDDAGREDVEKIREYVRTIQGFKNVHVIEQHKNKGLANSIIDGVTEIVTKYGKIIVLEDDIITSPAFLNYMNFCLEHFKDDDRVYSVNAYMSRVPNLPQYYFLHGGDCWGWGTWARSWKDFNPDTRYLYEQLAEKNLFEDFDYGGMKGIMEYAMKNPTKVWHIRWTASIYLKKKLGLFPGRSYVVNTGTDGGGTNSTAATLNAYSFEELETSVDERVIRTMTVEENPEIKNRIQDFHLRGQRFVTKITPALIIDKAKKRIHETLKPAVRMTNSATILRKAYSKIKAIFI